MISYEAAASLVETDPSPVGRAVKHFIKKGRGGDALLQCLLGSVDQGVAILDANLDFVLANAKVRHLLDLPDDIFDCCPNLRDLMRFCAERGDYGPGDPGEQVRSRMALARRTDIHGIDRHQPDGSIVHIQVAPMPDGGCVTIYTDVTQQRRTEAELNERRQSLEDRLAERTRELEENRDLLLDAINAIKDGIGIADKHGCVVLANEKMKEIYPKALALQGRGGFVSDVVRTAFPEEPERSVNDILRDDDMWTERQFPDGRWYKIERSRTSEGGFIAVYSDITEYKQQHATLQRHTDELVKLLRQEKKLNEMQREFVSMASHEFRTPLAIIDGSAQRLKRRIDRLEPEDVLERIKRIREAVERMQYLIERFMSFSEIQAKGIQVHLVPHPIRPLVEAVCDRYNEISAKHRIHTDLDALPEEVCIDHRLIEQCLVNIISNAVKYSPGQEEVQVRGWEEDGYAVISVRDHGVGIPQDELAKIFRRYFRASTSSGIAGTGIGLHMSEMVVRQHGGRIEIDSVLQKGTTVTIRLPIRDKAQRPAQKGAPRLMKQAS